MDTNEIEQIINKYSVASEIFNANTDKEYRKIIDVIPVDIRRIMLKDAGQSSLPLSGYKNLYTINTPIPEVMRILKIEIEKFIIIYRKLNRLDSSKEDLLKELLINHQNYTLTSKPDIYWWSNQFVKILN
jgi:N-glycosylase/DNA lyase